jgi:hypothetical protein
MVDVDTFLTPLYVGVVQLPDAAKMALPNFCTWLNKHLSRPWLAFTDLVDW